MDWKLPHRSKNPVLWRARVFYESVLFNVGRCTPCIHKVSRNNKNNDKKFMNESIVSAEAKARLTEAVKNYTPPPPEKYRALEEVKDCIIELRHKKASYQTIRAILHDNAGIEVSHQTIARYCREMLESRPPKAARKARTSREASDKKPTGDQKKLSPLPPPMASDSSQQRGPRIRLAI
jgi:IS30 family transposase